MSDAKNQHFVPRLLLKNFIDPDCPKHYKPFVWVRELGTNTWQRMGLQRVCSGNYFNSFIDNTGNLNHQYDKIIERFENVSVQLKKINDQKPLDVNDREALSLYMAFQMMRVPSVRDNIESFLNRNAKKMLHMKYKACLASAEHFEEMKADFKKRTGKEFPSEMQPADMNPDFYNIKVNKGYLLGLSLAHVGEVAQILFNMGWVVVCTEQPDYFITSDRPFIIFDKTNTEPYPGLLTKNTIATMSFSRTRALFASLDFTDTVYDSATATLVSSINFQIGIQASHVLIASKPTFPGSDLIEKVLRARLDASPTSTPP